MADIWVIVGALIALITIWDAFETIILPRTVRRRFRLSRFIIAASWVPFRMSAHRTVGARSRDSLLSVYGPLLLTLIFVTWVLALIFGFGLIYHGLGSVSPNTWFDAFYYSGTTFFTLGLGDLSSTNDAGRVLSVLEAGLGFALLALVIGYLPIFYQTFSRRELSISLLDARAGSPPTAYEFIRRNRGQVHTTLLSQWETWAAELLEGHLSYPVLVFFRSQHERQSWLAALTMILDTASLIMCGVEGVPMQQARFTYGIARHCLVDLTQVLFLEPKPPMPDRLPHDDYVELQRRFERLDLHLIEPRYAEEELTRLRAGYEGMANALAQRLLIELPGFMPAPDGEDNWETSPWDRMSSYRETRF